MNVRPLCSGRIIAFFVSSVLLRTNSSGLPAYRYTVTNSECARFIYASMSEIRIFEMHRNPLIFMPVNVSAVTMTRKPCVVSISDSQRQLLRPSAIVISLR